jgi:hypothetical protein
MIKLKKFLLLLISVFIFACGGGEEEPSDQPNTKPSASQQPALSLVAMPDFSPDSAYAFIARQVSFGPRIPNSPEHQIAGDWLIDKLGSYTDTVFVQAFSKKAWDGEVLYGRNIIGSFNPNATDRIMLSAHWDTRPQADMDPMDRNAQMDGANDGASGVGVLIEIARVLSSENFDLGVDIIFWDLEDYGASGVADSYCYGSQHWSNNHHIPGYDAHYGILLDMVGSKGATFRRETYSTEYAYDLVNVVWQLAGKMGHSEFVQLNTTTPIIDDHYYLNSMAGIPTVNIIDYREMSFAPTWHTRDDNMMNIDKEVLRAAGETTLQVVYQEIAGKPVI